VRDIYCTATIHIRLERRRLSLTHPLEINLKHTHNHVINSAEVLSFRYIKREVREELVKLFIDEHSPSSALYVYEDILHLNITNKQELIENLTDRAINPDYGYVANLFQQYREETLGSCNGESMFKRLEIIVEDYNNLDHGVRAARGLVSFRLRNQVLTSPY